MCKLVIEYLEYLGKPIENKKFCDSYLPNVSDIPAWLDEDMDEDDLIQFFNLYSLKVAPLDIRSGSAEIVFQDIVQNLKTNRLPILHMEPQGMVKPSHLRLITGYGTYAGCNYILVLDPFEEKANYEPSMFFLNDSQQFWSCKPEVISQPSVQVELLRDSEIENQINIFSSKLRDYNKQNEKKININPLIVFHRDYAVVKHYLEIDFNSALPNTIGLLSYMSESSKCNSSIQKTSAIEKFSKSLNPILSFDIDYVLQKMGEFDIERNVVGFENFDVEINKVGYTYERDSFQFNLKDEDGLRGKNEFLKWNNLTDFVTKN